MNKWQALHDQYAQSAFQGNGHAYTQEAKIAELERLMGQQTAEISFLSQESLKSLADPGAAAQGGKALSQVIQEAAVQGGSLTNLCQMAGISRACFYRGLVAPESAKTGGALRERIQQVALDWSCYGYRRVTQELHRQSIQANHKRILRLMREDNLLCLRKSGSWR